MKVAGNSVLLSPVAAANACQVQLGEYIIAMDSALGLQLSTHVFLAAALIQLNLGDVHIP